MARWCPRCGARKEDHELDRTIATDGYGFTLIQRERYCDLRRVPGPTIAGLPRVFRRRGLVRA